MKTRVHNPSSSNLQIIKVSSYNKQQCAINETVAIDENDSSSDETYDSNSDEINVKSEFAAEECIPDDGLDLYEEQTVESAYSGLTDYNILKDLVAQSVKNEGELLIHSNFNTEHNEEDGNLIKHEYDEVDPNEYEVVDQVHTMAYEEHVDIETQEEIKFTCGKCPLKFESNKELQNHKKIHNDKPFSCQICSRKFKKEMGMKVHISLMHGKQESKMTFKLQVTGNETKPTTSKKGGRKKLNNDNTLNYTQGYQCIDCCRQFEQLNHLKNHLKFHNQRKSKPYECDLCFKCFGQRGNLDTHKKIHLGDKQFKCQLCTRAFFQKGNLTTHLKIHAQNEKNLKRAVKCMKSKPTKFTRQSQQPSRSQPELNVKKYSCDVCSKSFLQLTNLHTHMRTHTGNRPYVCSYCSKSFTQVGNLQKHLKIHTGERPFKCEVCSKAFVQKCQMQKHMGVHASEPNAKHVRKQSVPRIKVFQCKNCSKKYKQNVNLKKHMEKCINKTTQHIPAKGNTKQIHFEKIAKVDEEDNSEYLSDSTDNASVSGNASTDSSNDDSSDFEMSDYD